MAHRLGWHAGLRTYHVLALPASEGDDERSGLAAARPAAPPDLARIEKDPALDMPPGWTGAATLRGDRCAIAEVDGRTGGYVWLSNGAAPYSDTHALVVPAGWLYAYKAFVAPALRGRGAGRALYRFAAREAAGQGCRGVLLLVSPRNVAGVASARRAGAEDLGTLVLWCAGRGLRVLHAPERAPAFRFEPVA